METDESFVEGFEAARWHIPAPILAIVGPLLGLGYIIVLPFVGVGAFIATSFYRIAHRLATR